MLYMAFHTTFNMWLSITCKKWNISQLRVPSAIVGINNGLNSICIVCILLYINSIGVVLRTTYAWFTKLKLIRGLKIKMKSRLVHARVCGHVVAAKCSTKSNWRFLHQDYFHWNIFRHTSAFSDSSFRFRVVLLASSVLINRLTPTDLSN